MAEIYVVEDDESIREIETIALQSAGHAVKGFSSAADFLGEVKRQVPDLCVLDIMLPDRDGYELVRELRESPQTAQLPIICLTARTAEVDLIRALEIGADDYMKKPFSVMELLSRVKALLRRTEREGEKSLESGGILLDPASRSVSALGQTVDLTYKEFELLRFLMEHAGTVQSRDAIMSHVWGTEYEGETRTVDMHIRTLRRKLGEAGALVRTVRNVGYVLDQERFFT